MVCEGLGWFLEVCEGGFWRFGVVVYGELSGSF